MSITPLPDGEAPLGAALTHALSALGSAAEVAAWTLREDDLRQGLAQLDLVARLAQAQQVRLAAEAHQRGLPAHSGQRRLAGWVKQVLPAHTDAEARRLAGRAQTLYAAPAAAQLGPTREALLAGQVSASQADTITTTLTALLPPTVPAGQVPEPALAQAQALLLSRADLDDATELHAIGRRLHAILDPDADQRLATDEAAREQARGLTLATLRSGLVHLQATLTPRCGAALTAAIDAWSAPQPAADATPDPRTSAQRRHDGLQRLAEEAITRPGLLPTSHGSPHRILTTVSIQALQAALTDQTTQPGQAVLPGTLPDGTPLSSTSLAEIACSADLVAVLIDGHGNPLDVGDTQYAFPTKQRLAIAVRDQHCTYPGCTAPPAWCDVHHLTPFSRGGRTSITNGTLLCGHHHRHVHTHAMTGHLHHGTITWTTTPPPSDHQPQAPPAQAPPPRTRADTAIHHLARRWRVHRRE